MHTMKHSVLDRGATPLRTVLLLCWPAVVEQLLLTMVNYVDTAMVGSIGADATAAVAVNTSTLWLINSLLSALGTGFTFLVARAVGAGDEERAKTAAQHALLCAAVLGLFLTCAVRTLSHWLPLWLGAAEEIIPAARMYMATVSSALMFQAFLCVCSAIIRGAGDTKTPLKINLATNFLNVIGNFLLIYPTRAIELGGHSFVIWGANLGVWGAALSTAGAQILGGTLLVLSLFAKPSPIRQSLKRRFSWNGGMLRDVLRVGLPAAFERSCLSFGQIALTSMVTRLGTVQLAAHHLAITAESLSYLPAGGLSSTATTLVGQALGAQREKDAETFGKLTYRLGVLSMTLGGLLLYFCSVPLMHIFTQDVGVIEYGSQVLRIVAIAEPFFGLNIVISGALYGAGDTRFPFLVSLIGMWGVRIGLAYVLSYTLNWGLAGAWVAMSADLVVRGTLCYLRFRGGRWKTVWTARNPS